jgi:hypothetical protein
MMFIIILPQLITFPNPTEADNWLLNNLGLSLPDSLYKAYEEGVIKSQRVGKYLIRVTSTIP